MERDFFISYNRADRGWAEWIAWQLEGAGYTTVLQAWDFRPGGNFALQMQDASAQTQRTIAVLSPDYLQSGFAASEWAEAFAADPTGEQGLLLPVRVRDCDPEGVLSQIVYVDLVGLDAPAARDALLDGVKRGRARPSTAPGFPGKPDSPVHERPRFPGSPAPPDVAPAPATPTTALGASTTPSSSATSSSTGIRARWHPDWMRLRSAWSSLSGVGKALSGLLSAAAALLTALVAAGVLGDDRGDRDPIPTPTAATSELSGTLSNIKISDRTLLLEDFCRRRELPCTQYTSSELRWAGSVVSYTIMTAGYKGSELPITWSLYDARTGDQVTDPDFTGQPGWPDGVYKPAAERDQNSGELFIPNPKVPGMYSVRLELSPREGARLDVQSTEPFVVS